MPPTPPARRKAIWLTPTDLVNLANTHEAFRQYPPTVAKPRGWEQDVVSALIRKASSRGDDPVRHNPPRNTKKPTRQTRVKPTRKRHTRRT